MTGRTLAHYQVLEKLGQGGMGEVYRARDTKLARDVALKFLPEAFARDPERLARFEREARVLASLNHTNIAAIYGFENVDGVPFLVLEYVPGPTLAELVAKGPVTHDTSLAICNHVSRALEAAHEKGIVHRDLKPANVKVTPEDKVKVLDFGLAKALVEEPSGDAAHSPTMSALATRAGTILGTAAYMSPEQVRGKPLDKRADIWAFGCLLYELLTGQQAYGGETISDTMVAILSREPDWAALPADVGPGVVRLLRRCLERDRDRRLRDIGDSQIFLEDRSLPVAAHKEVSEPRPSRSGWSWLVAAVTTVALLALAVIHFRERPPAAPTTRFQVPPPDKSTSNDYPSISPDGRRLAFVATVEGKSLLWVRPLESLAAQPLVGTEEATFPFWSPDSRFLAFFAQNKLKKVDVTGGPPQTLCNAEGTGRGGTWNRDGTIVFGAGARDRLRRVPAAGGAPAPITTLDSQTELSHRWPQFLPDGRHFLYWLYTTDREKSAVVLATLDDKPDSKDRKRLLARGSLTVYSAGHMLFEREETLMAQLFDASRLEFRGEPFPVAQQVGQQVGSQGWWAFSASPDGTLAYRTGGGAKSQLAWFDRAGKELGRLGQPEEQTNPRLSPDQKRVAVGRRESQAAPDIWLLDLTRETSTRFTFHPAIDGFPLWSPDGGRIVFASGREGPYNLYQKVSSGAANEEPLLKSNETKNPTDWSSDGRFLLYQAIGAKTAYDLWALPLDGDRKPFPVLQTEFSETLGQFSPDGRWIAYQSTESGTAHVYVQGFPKSGGKFQVSTTGGGRPRWRRDGKELYYLSTDRKMMAVDVKATAATFEVGRPRELFQTRAATTPFYIHNYDVAADGQRFLINTALEAEGPPPMTVVMNWARGN